MFFAELLKVRSHRLPWITYGVYATLLALVALLSTLGGGGGEAALPVIAATVHLQIGFVFALILGAWMGGGDFAAGTWRVILARDDRRVLQLANRVAVLVVAVAAGALLTFLVGIAAATIVSVAGGNDPIFTSIWGYFWASLVLEIAYALFAFALAVLFRSTAAAMSIGLAYAFVADTLLFSLWPDVQPFLMSTALGQITSSLVGFGSTGAGFAAIFGQSVSISTVRAWCTLAVWLGLLVGGAALVFRRRDVTS